MLIISGFKSEGSPKISEMLYHLKRSTERFGYRMKIYDLPTMFKWEKQYPEVFFTTCCKYKIPFLLEVLDEVQEDILWIDADCLVMREIDFDDVLSGCDLAFTLRDLSDRHYSSTPSYDGYINSGVIFVKNNACARYFLKRVLEKMIYSVFDQDAINKLLLEWSNLGEHNKIINVDPVKVKILNSREYNFFYFGEPVGDARILHFKGEQRKFYEQYI